MAVTIAWDETAPAGTDSPRSGDNQIRDIKQAVRERMNIGGHFWPSATDTKSGRHQCGQEQAASGDGTPLAGEWYIYHSNGTTRIVTVSDATAASPSRFLASALNATFNDATMNGDLTVLHKATIGDNGPTDRFVLAAGMQMRYRLVSGNHSVSGDDCSILIDTSNDVDITLPLAAGDSGRILTITSMTAVLGGGNSHEVLRSGADTIVGPFYVGMPTSARLAASGGAVRGSIILVSDGTSKWIVVGGHLPV